jgi:hypothetical protein
MRRRANASAERQRAMCDDGGMSRLASIVSGCVYLFASPSLATPRDGASAPLSVTATVVPSCTIRVAAVPAASMPVAVLRCHPQDAARATVTTTIAPAATVSTDPAVRLVTINF